MSNYDNWLTYDPAQDIPEPPDDAYCPHCGEEMEFDAAVDCDEETGRPYYCGGGSYNCTNKDCPPEKEEEQE